jgi:hypothetical protein
MMQSMALYGPSGCNLVSRILPFITNSALAWPILEQMVWACAPLVARAEALIPGTRYSRAHSPCVLGTLVLCAPCWTQHSPDLGIEQNK